MIFLEHRKKRVQMMRRGKPYKATRKYFVIRRDKQRAQISRAAAEILTKENVVIHSTYHSYN